MNRVSRAIVLFVALAASLHGFANAQGAWTPLGPFGVGVRVSTLAIDPGQTRNVYAGYAAGAVRSTDRGAHWIRPASGIGGAIPSIAIDPRTPSTLYACSVLSVLKSVDSGVTWGAVGFGVPPNGCSTILVASDAAATVYVGGPLGVFRSGDGGSTWTAARVGLPLTFGVQTLAIDPGTPTTLYAASTNFLTEPDLNGFYKSTDAGATWSIRTNGIGNADIVGIVVSPSDPRVVYASVAVNFPGNAFRSTDRGESWTAIQPITVLAIDPRSSAIVYGGTGRSLNRSTDGGENFPDTGLAAIPTAVAIDPISTDTIYCGTLDSGVFRSDDAGATWQPVNQGLSDAVISDLGVDQFDPPYLYASLGSPPGIQGPRTPAVIRSSDRGDTWVRADGGAPSYDTIGSALFGSRLAFDRTSPAIYAAPLLSLELFKTLDRAETWSDAGRPNIDGAFGLTLFVTIAVDPVVGSTLYSAGYSCHSGGCGGAIFKSTDATATWNQISNAASSQTDIAIDPVTPSILYSSVNSQIRKSTDAGASWTALPANFGAAVARLAMAPGTPSVVYAIAGGLHRSADGGNTWVNASPPFAPSSTVSSILVDPIVPGVLYAGASRNGGVYRSFDGGDNWAPLGTALESFGVTALALDANDPPVLYAGTESAGVFRLPLDNVAGGSCFPTETTLCLNGARFRVGVTFQTDEAAGAGHAHPLTADTGAFWFFSSNNIELAVKVVDGRELNGKFWVFGGALTNVEYTLVITDTSTGAVWTRHNSPGELASFADAAAF